jgi:hypothetical protein
MLLNLLQLRFCPRAGSGARVPHPDCLPGRWRGTWHCDWSGSRHRFPSVFQRQTWCSGGEISGGCKNHIAWALTTAAIGRYLTTHISTAKSSVQSSQSLKYIVALPRRKSLMLFPPSLCCRHTYYEIDNL